MPAGLAQCHPRREDARTPDEALLDRFCKAAIGTAGIADRREAALQHAFEHLGRLQGQQGRRPVRQAGECRIDREDMDMRVDQPRHQGAAMEIDRLGRGAGDRPIRDFADPVALDQHVVILAALVASAVDHRAIGKNNRGHQASLPSAPDPNRYTSFPRTRESRAPGP